MTRDGLRLKHVARVIAGQSPPSRDVLDLDDELPFLQGNAEFGAEYPSPKYQCGSAPKRARSGDVLLSVRAPVGALNLADRELGIGRGLCAVRADGIHPRFLWWWIHTQVSFLNSVATGSTYTAVTAENVANVEMTYLPSLAEQRRIADFLDTETARIDALITNRSRQLELLPDRWRVGLDRVFDQLTAEFGQRSLGRAVVRMEQGTSPQCDNRPAEEHEWGVLKAGAVRGDRFLPEENKHLPDWIAPEVRYEVRPGDLLITRANTPALVGAAAVVPAGTRTRLILCDKIFRVRLDSSLRHEFVALLSQASRIRDARVVSATGASSSMVNLSTLDVKQWPIPMAPVPFQTMRIRELEAARSLQEALGLAILRQASLLVERRQTLITAAVTGAFDVTTARGVSA